MANREDQLIGTFPFVPQQERALQKRNALLESGHAMFASKGYTQTTAKEIAANAGVATGTFYRYFSDKRQLLMALLEDKIDKFMPPEPTWLSQDPETRLAKLLEDHDRRLNELGLHLVLPELLVKDSEMKEVFALARMKLQTRIYDGLKMASEKGLTWKDLDLEIVARSILLLVENTPGKAGDIGNKEVYAAISKVICRMVFPPEMINQLKNPPRKIEEIE